jgi:hypothetical protein
VENLLTVAFEAHHPEKNHHRRYEFVIGRDLLDAWTVSIRFGRAGQGGCELRYASAQPEEIRAVIRERLRRRLSAPKRIGCSYRLTALSSAPGFDASAWLPGELMNGFFKSDQKTKAVWSRRQFTDLSLDLPLQAL